MAEHRLDSVAQNKPLGQPQMSLDEMAARAEEISKSLNSPQQTQPQVLQATTTPQKKRTLDTRFRNSESQIEQLEKENY